MTCQHSRQTLKFLNLAKFSQFPYISYLDCRHKALYHDDRFIFFKRHFCSILHRWSQCFSCTSCVSRSALVLYRICYRVRRVTKRWSKYSTCTVVYQACMSTQAQISRHKAHAAKALRWRIEQLLKCLIKKRTLSAWLCFASRSARLKFGYAVRIWVWNANYRNCAWLYFSM